MKEDNQRTWDKTPHQIDPLVTLGHFGARGVTMAVLHINDLEIFFILRNQCFLNWTCAIFLHIFTLFLFILLQAEDITPPATCLGCPGTTFLFYFFFLNATLAKFTH